jgi:hypothetical protein
MVLVTDFARGVSVPRPLPLPPSPCARWVRVGSSLAASLLLSLVWLASFTRLFLRYNQWAVDPHHFGNLDPDPQLDPHQSHKLDPDPHQFADDKPNCMEYEPV